MVSAVQLKYRDLQGWVQGSVAESPRVSKDPGSIYSTEWEQSETLSDHMFLEHDTFYAIYGVNIKAQINYPAICVP